MSGYVDAVVLPHDEALGPMLFEHYGENTARRIAAFAPQDVLEVAADTRIVTLH